MTELRENCNLSLREDYASPRAAAILVRSGGGRDSRQSPADSGLLAHPIQQSRTVSATWSGVNIFANAAFIDILNPVATEAGLGESLLLARRFLSSQIEAGGLVRYHGRPDAATIGTLGCAITPDADDTALVWRIAPSPHSELLPLALATLERLGTPQGLYRTWLAPRDRYECIDVGKVEIADERIDNDDFQNDVDDVVETRHALTSFGYERLFQSL